MNVAVQKAQWGVNYCAGYSAFLIRKGDFISAGIRWFEHWDDVPNLPSPSHAFIITGKDSTVEAFGDGIHTGTLSGYLHDMTCAVLVRRPLHYTPDMGVRIVQAANAHLGDHYNYALIGAMAVSNSLLGHGLDMLTRGWFSRAVDGLADRKRYAICSQLVALAMQPQEEVMALGVLARPAYTITPMDLVRDQYIYEPDDYATELI